MGNSVLITQIQRFALNDGPGIRTNVFLKGCPLKCQWCHNPENINPLSEIFWKKRLCTQCGRCLDACKNDAIVPPVNPDILDDENVHYYKIQKDKCVLCMECVKACIYNALEVSGKAMSIEEIIQEVLSDLPFYRNSGGGMTLSGGEPTSHIEFSINLLKEAKKNALHVCLDTNGFCNWDSLESLIKYTDIVLFDLKHLDSNLHYKMTGVKNDLIIDNLKKLANSGQTFWIRIPVIPDFNDSIDYHKDVSAFIRELKGNIERIDLLPFHNWCQDKYFWLGLDWSYVEIESMHPENLKKFLEVYSNLGIKTTIGGSGFEK